MRRGLFLSLALLGGLSACAPQVETTQFATGGGVRMSQGNALVALPLGSSADDYWCAAAKAGQNDAAWAEAGIRRISAPLTLPTGAAKDGPVVIFAPATSTAMQDLPAGLGVAEVTGIFDSPVGETRSLDAALAACGV
ncbi:MAG: hypothetical protein ACPGNV_01930 [Mangrovicoccus sp.]